MLALGAIIAAVCWDGCRGIFSVVWANADESTSTAECCLLIDRPLRYRREVWVVFIHSQQKERVMQRTCARGLCTLHKEEHATSIVTVDYRGRLSVQ